MNSTFSRAALGFAAISLAAPAWCATEAELVEKARQETVLNIGSNQLAYGALLVESFAREYPWLQVRHDTFGPVDTDAAEAGFKTQNPDKSFDVVMRCQEPHLADWVDRSWLARLDDIPNWKKRPAHLEDDARYVYFLGAPHVLLYNSRLVPDEWAPRTYAELVEPRWKDKVALRSPLMGNSGAFLVEFILGTRGNLDWYTQLGRNHALVTDTFKELFNSVQRGERSVAVARDVEWLSVPKTAETQDVKMRFAEDELPYQYQLALVNAKAPHPYAARLFMNWLLSERVQEILANAGYSVADRQKAHLARPHVWQLDVQRQRKGHDARLQEAVKNLREGGAAWSDASAARSPTRSPGR